jgi:hypothetical protein
MMTGKLMVSFRPGFTVPDNVYQMSADPCVEIDLSAANSGLIKFPTLIPTTWLFVENFSAPVVGGFPIYGFDYGVAYVSTISPPSESVAYTCYAWLEDVDLRGAGYTNFGITPQVKTKADGKEEEVCEAAQVVQAKNAGELDKIKWNWKVENTPGWLNTIGASVETIGGAIQCLEESILGPVGDFVDCVGESVTGVGMGLMAGLSVPPPPCSSNSTFISPIWAQSHIYTNSPLMQLSCVQGQKVVAHRNLFGSNADEMNIKTFCMRKALVGKFTWAGSTLPGVTLCRWNVMPGLTPDGTFVSGIVSTSPSPLALAACMFKLWRGAIRYRLAVAKTAFHTGTLEVVWQMGKCLAVPSSASHDSLCSRLIWDVTRSSSIEFEVPYFAPVPYTPVYLARFSDTFLHSDQFTGVIFVNVINPLSSAGGTVPPAITVLVSISGSPDTEFAVPGLCQQMSAFYTVPPPEAGEVEPQVGPFSDDQSRDGLSKDKVIMMHPSPAVSPWANLSTIGERVLSFRALIKRFGINITGNGTYSYTHVRSSNIFLRLLDRTFAFRTGGYRLNFYTRAGSTTPFYFLIWNGSGRLGTAHCTIRPESNMTALEVPYYGLTPFIYALDPNSCSVFVQDISSSSIYVEGSAADDFEYGFQFGSSSISYVLVPNSPYF